MTNIREVRSAEQGFTMIELVVASTLMMFFLAMFTSGLVSAFSSSRTVQSSVTNHSETNVAYLQLSRLVRGATAISTPGKVGSAWFVELLTTSFASASSSPSPTPSPTPPQCTQLRLDSTNTLAQQTWPASGTATGAWTVLASNVTTVTTGNPFVVSPTSTPTPGAATAPTTLTVTLSAVGTSSPALQATFTLGNSAASLGDASVCSSARPSS